ncbi:MAG TPA: EAL domain-containing protein [Solirubrobacteraceae bacterium]|nr:EAL domain-containing protein [Solirubrobacteraceae bacterium]
MTALPHDAPPPRENTAGAPARPGPRRWMLLAWALLAIGVAGSLGGAALWRSSARANARQGFQVTATDVSETLETLLLRDADFVKTLRSVLTLQPHMSATRFEQWFSELSKERRLGGLGATVVEAVPASELAAFLARRAADPTFRTLVGGTIVPVSRGGRVRYCLLSAGGAQTPYSPAIGEILEGDWCDPRSAIGSYPAGRSTTANVEQAVTDSGQFVVYPVTAQGVTTVFIEAAFYRHGAALATVAERRAAVGGWVAASFDIGALIDEAVGQHRGLGVSLYHQNPGQTAELIGHAGVVTAKGALSHRAALGIDGRWWALVRGAAVVHGLTADTQGLLVLAIGLLLTLLVCALVMVLARSRERALTMVREKTGQLQHQALHDALTGLPNRILALDRAQQMLARARRRHTAVAALYIDLDGFKHVNDTFGHAAGDELLRIVADRLQAAIRDSDTASRLGGDEFLALLEEAPTDAGPELIAERVLEVLRQPYDLGDTLGRPLSITASIGIASGPRLHADELLRDADLALYQAKLTGRDRFSLFESSMQAASDERLTLELDLAQALEQEQLFLLYQPTFDLRTGSVIGVEALIRWRQPERGIVPPDKFIPIAEQRGMIVPIGRWVLEEACRQLSVWHALGYRIGMAVNVSARQLDDDSLIDDVRRALEDNELEPSALTLEITETALMRDPDATAARLHQLKQLGVRIAIDDFGTGYSSLAYLRQFPADALKIDRSFIDGIATSKASAALIHTLVQLGKALEIETLAEGIEDQAQLETLQREHCDHGQGFLFSRPLDVDAVELFLSHTSSHASALAASE